MEDTHSYFAGTNEVWVHNYEEQQYNYSTTFWGDTKERFSNLMDGKGFNTNNRVIENEITGEGEMNGLIAELQKKKSSGMKLNSQEVDLLKKNDMLSDTKLSAKERREIEKQLEGAELGHSLAMFQRWSDEGRKEFGLTPFIKKALQIQFGDHINLDAVRIRNENSNFFEKLWNKMTGAPIAFVYGDSNLIQVKNKGEFFNEENEVAGGLDQFRVSGLGSVSSLHVLGHELGHMVQRRLHEKTYAERGNEYMNFRNAHEKPYGESGYLIGPNGHQVFGKDESLLTKVDSRENISNTMNSLAVSYYTIQTETPHDPLFLIKSNVSGRPEIIKPTLDHWADISGKISYNLMYARFQHSTPFYNNYVKTENNRLCYAPNRKACQ